MHLNWKSILNLAGAISGIVGLSLTLLDPANIRPWLRASVGLGLGLLAGWLLRKAYDLRVHSEAGEADSPLTARIQAWSLRLGSARIGIPILAILLGAAGLWGYMEVQNQSRTSLFLVSPLIREDSAEMLLQFREKWPSRSLTSEQRQAIRDLFGRWARVETDFLSSVTGKDALMRFFLYARSLDQSKLQPVASNGAPGYVIDGHESIGACSLEWDMVVYWRGRSNQTVEIRGWTENGDPVGSYDPRLRSLIFRRGAEQRECQFDIRGDDQKDELLCLPVGASQPHEKPAPGVVCIASYQSPVPLDTAWLRSYLAWNLMPMGLFDAEALLDTPDKAPPKSSSPPQFLAPGENASTAF